MSQLLEPLSPSRGSWEMHLGIRARPCPNRTLGEGHKLKERRAAKWNYLEIPILSNYHFAENEHRKKVSREGRLGCSEARGNYIHRETGRLTREIQRPDRSVLPPVGRSSRINRVNDLTQWPSRLWTVSSALSRSPRPQEEWRGIPILGLDQQISGWWRRELHFKVTVIKSPLRPGHTCNSIPRTNLR